MPQNKKIKNATPLEYEGIKFKSRLEVGCYKYLRSQGIYPQYEALTFIIWNGCKPTIPFYERGRGGFKLQSAKLRDITYTPDFTFMYGSTQVIIEVKGYENNVFPVKKKLFRGCLEGTHSIYFEVRSKRELQQALEILKKNYSDDRRKKT